ncbi:hypothetical protein C8J56DRAFT_896199 [Mycena floridula]|nr:hypothetical protein C8J56DRAFT_896199 [Mycena floridula]
MQDWEASNPNPNQGIGNPIPPPRQSSVLSPPVSPNQGSGIPGNGSLGSNGNGRLGNKRQGSGNERQGSLSGRARPTPPVSAAGQKPMTAAEEKALLGAKFGVTPSASRINGGINGTGTKVPTTPPPLMPCPPVSYIPETQEEDARVSRMVLVDAFVPLGDSGCSPDDGKRFPREDLKRGSSSNGVTEGGYGGEEVNGTGLKTPGPTGVGGRATVDF